MANVLCVYENRIATVESLEDFLLRLSASDSRIQVNSLPVSKVTNEQISNCDILFLIRPNQAFFARLARLARSKGILTVFFLDDDLCNLPKDLVSIPWQKKGLIAAVNASDVVVSPNPILCKKYAQLGGITRTLISDTAVPKDDIQKHEPHKNERLKIVYAAGLAHKTMFDHFVRPILSKLDEQYGDRISLTFMGVHPELNPDEYRMPIEYIASLPLKAYRERIAKENFDLGLAPLLTNDFTKCKYFNKFIEYAMFGIVGLYSDTEPYSFVIEDRKNGLLVGNTPENWFQAISFAIENPEVIGQCRKNAYNLLETRFQIEQLIQKYNQAIPELVSPHQKRDVRGIKISLYKIVYCLSRFRDWIYKACFYLKKGGLTELYKSVTRHFHIKKSMR